MGKDIVENGLVVSMEYTLRVNGEVLDSSEEAGILQYLAGYDNIVPGLEREMLGMKIGESKVVVVPAAEGYGDFDDTAFMDVPRSEFPREVTIERGVELHVTDVDGNHQMAFVDSFTDDAVRLDFNHPLAGAELHFSVRVAALRDPTAEELDHGHVHEGGHHH